MRAPSLPSFLQPLRKLRFPRFSRPSWISPRQARHILLTVGGFILLYLLLIISGALFIYQKQVENSYTHFVEKIFPYPAALVDGEVIPLSRFRTEVAARRFYSVKHDITTTPQETEQFVMTQLVNRTLYRHALQNAKMGVDQKSVEDQLNEIYQQSGGADKLTQFLHENYGDEITIAIFRRWIEEAASESAIQKQLLTRATVRHILIAVPEAATPEQIEAARQKALQVKSEISPDLQNFSDVAKNRSEDVASRDNGGAFGTTNRGDETPVLSADFENAIFTLPIGQISEPVRTSFGWHLIIVDERAGSVDQSKKVFTENLRKDHKLRIFLGN